MITMPNNQNNNEGEINETDKKDVSSSQTSQKQQAVTPDTSKEVSGVVQGALDKARMRTFRGDITQNLGEKAPRAIEHLVPKKDTPVIDQKLRTNPQVMKKKNQAVVHTFKDDVQDLVRNRKMSMARIAALESDRRAGGGDIKGNSSQESWKMMVVIGLIILFLVIASVLGLGMFYTQFSNQTSSTNTVQFPPAMIFTEARERIDVSDQDTQGIVSLLASARFNSYFSLGSVVEFYPTTKVENDKGETITTHLTAAEFLQSIEANVPETFLQTLGPDYVVGVHMIDESVPFLILTTNSYGHAFSGMLKWEQRIEEDLSPFFSPVVHSQKLTATEGQNTFSDSVIENLDVRVLRDSEDTIRVLYTFVDRNSILITTNIRTLIELSNRLKVQRQ